MSWGAWARSVAVAGLVGGSVVFAIEAIDRVVTLWSSFNSAAEPFAFALYLAPVIFLGLAAGVVVGPALALVGWIVRTIERLVRRRLGARAALVAPIALAALVTVVAGIGIRLAMWEFRVRSLRKVGLMVSLYLVDANAMLMAKVAHAAANWVFVLILGGVFVATLLVALAPRMIDAAPARPVARWLPAALAGLVVVAIYYFDSRFEYARYDMIFHVPAAVLQCALAYFAAALALRGGARAGRAALAILAFAILASGFAVFHVGANENLKTLLWRRSVVARRAYAIAVNLTDRDRDGFSSFLAGGDTDDRNPAVNPLATEIPGNGVDDNCIGGDLAVGPPAPAPIAAVSPNGKRFVLIAIDTLRADRMSLYGYGRPTTPRIEEHARTGLVFDRCFSPGTNTAVAFSTMQTSASRGGVFEPDRTRLWPTLRGAGYQTGMVNAVLEDIWLRAKSSSTPYRRVILDGIHDFPHELGEDYWDADRVTDAAIEYLSAIPAGAPSAMWVHYFDPHTPRKKMAPFDYGDSASDNYDTEVEFADREVGRLLDWMRSSGFMENTIVILTADHGEAFLEHGMDFHGNRPYHEQVDVPLVVWAPGLAPGRTSAPATLLDIAPTVFDFVGLGAMPGAEGRSLLTPPPADRPIFSETPLNIVDGPFHAFAVTEGRWRLIFDVVGNTTELYDLEHDPTELHNLADSEPARVTAMRATLAHWLDTTRSVASASEARGVLEQD